MRLSRIDQHIKDEPCAKQRALLGIPLAVPQAFLEVSDLRAHFFSRFTFSTFKTSLDSKFSNGSAVELPAIHTSMYILNLVYT
jgi:hypothetical protein